MKLPSSLALFLSWSNLTLPIAGTSALLLLFVSCGKSSEPDMMLARTPQEAASQIEQAFTDADPATQQAAKAASEALRSGDYQKAIVALETTRGGPSVTVDQGLAIHSSTVALEAKLIQAIAAGDKNAERAYEMLKAMKRK